MLCVAYNKGMYVGMIMCHEVSNTELVLKLFRLGAKLFF